jgi:hypothetical protein
MPPWVQFCTNKKEQSRVFMAHVMKTKDQKLTEPVLQGDPKDELSVPPPYIPSTLPSLQQPVPPLPNSPPPSMSPPQPHQQPPSPNDVSHPSPAWSSSPQPLSHHLHSSHALQTRALQMLLHETQGPQQNGADGRVHPGHCIFYYQTFSITDLLNWRNHTLPYSEKLQAMIRTINPLGMTAIRSS